MNRWDKYTRKITDEYEEVNLEYLVDVVAHIEDISKQEAEELEWEIEYARMRKNVSKVEKSLDKLNLVTIATLNTIWKMQASSDYKAASKYYEHSDTVQVPFKKNKAVNGVIDSLKQDTASSLHNISRTTITNANYIREIDKAIRAVRGGETTRQSEIKRIVRDFSRTGGLRCGYPGGRTMRLDSVLFRTIGDGYRRLSREQSRAMGEEFGADGVEIDAHGLCAKDHIPFQGKQFPLSKFYDESGEQIMDTGRPIGELNCRHNVSYIILGVSDPVYSDKQLNQFKRLSNQKVEVGGRTMTRYEASQRMRAIETQVRYAKEEFLLTGDLAVKERIARLEELYDETSEVADIVTEYERMEI